MKKVIFLSSLLAISLSGCSVYNSVSSTQADGIDFRKAFHTYAWMPDKTDTVNTAYNNEILRDNIRKAVNHELDARRLTAAIDDSGADLMLQLVVENRDRSRDYGRLMPSFFFGPFGASYNSTRSYYAHNRLTLNMYDHKTNRLVWTCTVEGDLDNAKQLSGNIQPAVAKIMKKYPVQPVQRAS